MGFCQHVVGNARATCWPSQVYILKACCFMSPRLCLKLKSMQCVLTALGRKHLSLKGLGVASGSGASQHLHRTPSLNILYAPLTDLGPWQGHEGR